MDCKLKFSTTPNERGFGFHISVVYKKYFWLYMYIWKFQLSVGQP